jgi:beta-fructofuranosidase
MTSDMETALRRAEASVDRLLAGRDDRWYPAAHIAARAGWINDPNGLSFVDGRYQVYFQHHPGSAQWGPMHWGHVSSADMATWRREPIALAPSIEEDRDGVFSGCAVIRDDGVLAVFYTGHRWRNGTDERQGNLQVQCLALSTDGGRTFEKRGMVVDCPEGVWHFRDPKVWRQGGRWYMVVGVSTVERRGQVWLYACEDPALEQWSFDGVLYEDPDERVFMLECPDFFPLGDKWVLTFGPMGARPRGYSERNGNNAVYVVGEWAPGQPFANVTGHRPGDGGANYYAPQSFLTPDGRRVLYGWMGAFTSSEPTCAADHWCGQLTVPRELALAPGGNAVLTVPVRECEALRAETRDFGAVELGADQDRVLVDDVPGAAEVELELDLARTTAERVDLVVHRTPDGHQTVVSWDDQSGRVWLDRRLSGRGGRGYRSVPVPASGSGRLRLRVVIDRSSVEVFVGEGEGVMSSLIFPPEGPRALVLSAESGVAVATSLRVHRLRSIWESPDR